MIDLPTLTIYFDPPDSRERTSLKLIFSENETPVTSSLSLPFRLVQIPLILRALNARQYDDYPDRERLIKQGDDRTQIISEVRALDLWDGNDETGSVAADVHVRLGRMLGTALLSDTQV